MARQPAGALDDDGEAKPRRKRKGRANGEGSVFESPKGSKKWIAQITLPDGRFKRARARTQREGLAKLQQMKQELIEAATATAEAAQAPAPTVREVCEHWLATFTMHLKPTVREDYEQELQRYVMSSWIADVKVDVLTHSQVQTWVNELAARLSARTVSHAYLRLRAALKIAVKEKHMAENVALDIVLPRVQSNKTSQALTVEQVRAFLQVVGGHRLEALFFVAITLGFREGELLGLLWSDIDLERGTVTISGNLQAVRGKLVRLTPKTEASKRTLDLSPEHIECLRQHWQNQQEERVISERKAAQKARETCETPRSWNEASYVFCSETGTPIWPSNFYGDFKRFAARAGLPDDVRPHDLRHTAGSLMIEDGESIVTVSEVLGHSNPSVTAKVYSHGYRDSRKRATGSLAKKLRRSE